jgi:short-subunit dehydrogenase
MSLPAPAADSVVIVTGASSGIGAELARSLAGLGHDLVLVARRADRLEELAEELRAAHAGDVLVHAADLTTSTAREGLLGFVAEAGRTVVGLCNNAGYGLAGRAWALDPDDDRGQIELNVVALHDLTLLVVPGMVERGAGAVLNVASGAAFQPMPGMATYAATKAFVHAFSEAVHTELAGTGVSVTTLYPGPVATEFGDRAGFAPEQELPGILVVDAADVARQAVDAMVAGRRSVIPGAGNKVTGLLGRYTPRTVLLPVMKWQAGSGSGS